MSALTYHRLNFIKERERRTRPLHFFLQLVELLNQLFSIPLLLKPSSVFRNLHYQLAIYNVLFFCPFSRLRRRDMLPHAEQSFWAWLWYHVATYSRRRFVGKNTAELRQCALLGYRHRPAIRLRRVERWDRHWARIFHRWLHNHTQLFFIPLSFHISGRLLRRVKIEAIFPISER